MVYRTRNPPVKEAYRLLPVIGRVLLYYFNNTIMLCAYPVNRKRKIHNFLRKQSFEGNSSCTNIGRYGMIRAISSKTLEKKREIRMKKWILLAADIAAAGLIVLAIYIVNYRLPKEGVEASVMNQPTTDIVESETEEILGRKTNVVWPQEDWHEKFRDKFTDTVVSTETSYTSPNVSIELSEHSFDTGVPSFYGTEAAYMLADIYIGDITCLQTAFAENMYGVGYDEEIKSVADRSNALLIINGDSYGNDMNTNNGTVVRNGVIYRTQSTDMETCILNWDGTMEIYPPGGGNAGGTAC